MAEAERINGVLSSDTEDVETISEGGNVLKLIDFLVHDNQAKQMTKTNCKLQRVFWLTLDHVIAVETFSGFQDLPFTSVEDPLSSRNGFDSFPFYCSL